MMNTSEDAAHWLESFENNERLAFYKPFTLDTMRLLARAAGNPEASAPVIHIAGSKGKGSVAAMITAILEAAGLKTARYTSPQVTGYWDRICQGNAPFHEQVYVEAGRELERVEARFRRDFPDAGRPSFFEMFTLLYFLCARIARVDAMVVETGLGGTHDATNVVIPDVSVLTLIEKEHTEVLGGTLRSIAAHKAGIIKRGKPVVSVEQDGAALAIFRETAAERDAAFHYLPEKARAVNISLSREGTAFTLECFGGAPFAARTGRPIFPPELDLSLRVPGEVQAHNAALAVTAAKLAFPLIDGAAARRGLAALTLPARFERLSTEPDFIIDGAHTKRSMEACVKTFTELYGQGGALLFGCAAGKDAAALAAILVPVFSRVIITRPGTWKASNPEEAYTAFRAAARGTATEIVLTPDTEEAVRRAVITAREARLPLFATGSFYLAAEARRIFAGSRERRGNAG
jgi:dihydrofolate synthase/folylpolyglutamate synthase